MKSVLFLFLLLLGGTVTAQTTIFPFGSSWRYLDNGTDQGTAWRNTTFDDGAWKTGNGKLGYGLSGLTTTVSFGPSSSNKYITTYFRRTFNLTNVASFSSFTAMAYREDGIVVYVNGVEVFRNNMPTGTITYTTVASASPSNDGADPVTFTIPTARFAEGVNTIAAEIHQKSGSSSDILFDLGLGATGGGPVNPAPSVTSINRLSPASPTTATTVFFRATFSETVTGVDGADFTVTPVNGNVGGTVNGVVPQGGNVYDVEVSGITGTGELRLDLKASGTGIQDADSQPITGGFTGGQTFTIGAQQPNGDINLIPFGNSWKYLDNGSNQGTLWTATAFNDASWKTGNGKLGYGISGLTTTVSFGPSSSSKYITTYFRKSISIDDIGTFTAFTANAYREDGIVVYVNGVEVYRNNMPTGTITYTTVASASPPSDGADPVTFTIPVARFVSGNNVVAAEVHQRSASSSDMMFDLNLIGTGGGTPSPNPSVSSIHRLSPASPTTQTTVTWRVTFSEAVTGVDVPDFAATRVSGDVSGTVDEVTPFGSGNNIYDVEVTGITGTGLLRLDLDASGTGIEDLEGHAITGGYTAGETFDIRADEPPPPTVYGFAGTVNVSGLSVSKHTGEKPQGKVWHHDGRWWCVLSDDDTRIYRLDGTTWTSVLTLHSSTGRSDSWVVGGVVHVLLFRGASTTSYLVSAEYDSNLKTYKLWSQRPAPVSISFGSGVETAVLAMDGAGRLWIAYCGTTDVNVRWSDAPYSSWSSAIRLANNVLDDDICTLTPLPAKNQIGLFWSNQNTRRFYFRTHDNGANPSTWGPEELPGVESARDNVGLGLGDDHMNMTAGSDGTVYVAAKTGFDRDGFPKICMLIRRPNGIWDRLYPVTVGLGSTSGTRGIVVLNEALNKLKVVYGALEGGGDILYRESALDNISFGEAKTILDGDYANPTSTHQVYNNEVVILATNQGNDRAEGIIGYDDASSAPIVSNFQAAEAEQLAGPDRSGLQAELRGLPVRGQGQVRFSLPTSGAYTLTLYDLTGARLSVLQQGWARSGQVYTVAVDGSRLPGGMYLVRLQTAGGSKTLKLPVNP
ncbi:T9SS type A sorting domain-containing protein [Paraflavisolibacter sp. H34]|uniref:T9SS type A sorting domain-containing protein n=1 Tax=Huijunlia imazamoxiresistens TaxID=3127457 RepID=UPI003017EF50